MKYTALAIAIIATLALLWIGGEAHRANCGREERWGCSVLPWVRGEAQSSTENPFKNPLDQLDERVSP